jgi:hypothetical protein
LEIWAKNILTKKGVFNRNFWLNLSIKISEIQRAEVAQSVEQGTENPRVGSSILSLGTIEKLQMYFSGAFYFRVGSFRKAAS